MFQSNVLGLLEAVGLWFSSHIERRLDRLLAPVAKRLQRLPLAARIAASLMLFAAILLGLAVLLLVLICSLGQLIKALRS